MMYIFFFLFNLQSSHVFEKIAQTSFTLNNKLHNNNWNQDTTKMNFKSLKMFKFKSHFKVKKAF